MCLVIWERLRLLAKEKCNGFVAALVTWNRISFCSADTIQLKKQHHITRAPDYSSIFFSDELFFKYSAIVYHPLMGDCSYFSWVFLFFFWTSRFFRDISSVLAEQLLRDISHLADSEFRPEEVSLRKAGYCLRQRGWVLLHTLTLSSLKVWITSSCFGWIRMGFY